MHGLRRSPHAPPRLGQPRKRKRQLEFRDDWFSTLQNGTRLYPAFLVGKVEKAESYIHADENGLVPDDWNWLRWHRGNLVSKYASSNMIEIAHVQGDDGEIYFVNGRNEPDSRQANPSWHDEPGST